MTDAPRVFFFLERIMVSPASLLRSAARTRTPKQSTGLFLFVYANCPVRVSFYCKNKNSTRWVLFPFFGADYETRTRYLHLGKVTLYRMS